jgi:hypothetical protein
MCDYTARLLGSHLTIERLDGEPIIAEWDVIQQIKNEMAGEDAWAIEIFPAESEVVNEINRRHLWVVPEELMATFNLRKR